MSPHADKITYYTRGDDEYGILAILRTVPETVSVERLNPDGSWEDVSGIYGDIWWQGPETDMEMVPDNKVEGIIAAMRETWDRAAADAGDGGEGEDED